MTSANHVRATMLDVARRAGVSEKSVSRVVNREAHVSARLKEKVEEAIAALGYVPDPAARSLAGARSFTISLLVDTRGPHYAIKLIEGAYEACKRNGYHLQIENLDSTREDEFIVTCLQDIMRNNRLDGFILTPPFSDNMAVMDFLDMARIRFTRVAPFLERGRASCVFMDDAAAAAEVADYLVSRGHRRIGLVNGAMEHGAAVARRTGFLERLETIAPEAEITEAEGRFMFEDGIKAGAQLLSGDQRPTAIFAANDDSAAGVMTACAQLGIKVPHDVSICGFDDNFVARSVWPYLTTIYQPISELAEKAALMLFERQSDPDEIAQVLLDHRMIERDSVRDLTRQ